MNTGFITDLFKGPGNEYWDLGRIVAGVSTFSMILGAVWNVVLGLPLELGPAGLGGGLAAVLGGCAALIYAKDRAKAENVVAGTAASAELTASKAAVVEAADVKAAKERKKK